jgi:histidyl-tRNA synthetase
VTAETFAAARARGMRDLLPDEMDRVRSVEAAFAAECRAWGYREIRTPVIEPLHLFTSAGTLSPKALDSVYSFFDWDGWSGERVVLRPDSTIPAARLYGERFAAGSVAKLFYRQNVFRFTDDDSQREEWQCGVELIGDTGNAGDVELVLLALETLKPLALPDITVRLSHAGLVRAVLGAAGLASDEQAAAYDRLLDGDTGVVDEIEQRLPDLDAPLRLLFDVPGSGSGYLANIRAALLPAMPALAQPLDELAFVVSALEARGVTPAIQAALARSFEYYSGPLFKIYSGSTRVASGGRYDELIGLVSGAGVPASGFATYVDAVLPLLPPPAALVQQTRVLVRPVDDTPQSVAAAHEAAAALRTARVACEVTPGAETEATHTLTCGPGTLAISSSNGTRELASIADVVRALGSESA